MPFQLRTPQEERATGTTELRNPAYENTDHLGRSSVTPLEYLLYQPRYENETVDSETRNVVIRPGYDKLTPLKWRKRRENEGMSLPCEYDSLIRGQKKSQENSLGEIEPNCNENVLKKETLV